MLDGRQWTTTNLAAPIAGSYCYADDPANCLKYGRLYRWAAAQRACDSVGPGWRIPTNREWEALAAAYGGVDGPAPDSGKAAYRSLVAGGGSGFDALLGGGRDLSGGYARLEAHGFYWTASESDAGTAWFYNFGKSGLALHRHPDGEKARAFAVRCIAP